MLVDWALELLGRAASARRASSTWAPAAARSRWRSACAARRAGRRGRCQRRRARRRARATRDGSGLPTWRSRRPTGWPVRPAPRFDLIVSNPPYVADGDPHLPALRLEPRARARRRAPTASTPSARSSRRAPPTCSTGRLAAARARLRPGRSRARTAAGCRGFTEVPAGDDLAGIERCSGGTAGLNWDNQPNVTPQPAAPYRRFPMSRRPSNASTQLVKNPATSCCS